MVLLAVRIDCARIYTTAEHPELPLRGIFEPYPWYEVAQIILLAEVEMGIHSKRVMAALICTILAGASVVSAQSVAARLEGTVRDQTQAVIPGVTIKATNEATNVASETVTNEVGQYIFVTLPPGTYTVTAELPGFKKSVQTGMVLQVGDARTANFGLEPGAISESVEVLAEAPLMDLTTTKIGSVVEQRQIVELPLNGRNAMMLFYLQAGANPRDRLGSQQQNGGVDGLAPSTNNVKVEGIFASNSGYDYSPADPTVPVPQEAVGEYRVTTSGGLADAGRGSGAQVSVFLKSGSNEFHGSVFEFNRNTIFNANDFFSNRRGAERPSIKRNQFGFSLGGPIRKNKTFFFGTIEWQRQNEGTIENRFVYTQNVRQGIFRYNTQRANSSRDVDANGNPIVPFQTIPLLTVDASRQGFDTVFLPEILKVMPLPNNYDIGDGLNVAGYRYTSPRPFDGYQMLIKVDHEITTAHRLALAYSRFDYDNPQAQLYNGISPEGFREFKRAGSIRLVSTFTPRLTNELSIGGNLRLSLRPITNTAQETPRGNIQLVGLGTTSGLTGTNNGNINILRGRQSNPSVNIGFSDAATWIKTNHTLSFGGEFWYETLNRIIGTGHWPIIRTDNASNPATIPTTFAGLAANDRSRAQQLINDLTGTVGNVQQTFFLSGTRGYVPYQSNYQQLRQLEWSAFVQDIWKVRPNLSLNLGLRYELLPPGYIADGAYAYPIGGIDGALGVQGPTKQPTQWGLAANQGKNVARLDKNNFGPTVGFSWDPFGNGDTTVSGSYRVAFDRSMMVVYGQLSASNYGAATTTTITPFTRLSDPAFYGRILPIPTPQLFAPLGNTRDSRAYVIDPNIATPYTQSWSFRLARQFGKDWKVEATYVGNHGVGMWRANNLNQIEMRSNGFLEAFRIAQRNLARNGSPTNGESLGPLQALFALVPAGQNTLITQGQAAALANFLDTTTQTTGARGGLVARAGLPATFFRLNPQVENLNVIGNRTHSTWNGLKLSANRRLHQGMYAQANYTLGKGFTDYITQQTLYEDYRDNANARLDKAVQQFDSTHTISANWIYELPFGNQRRFLSTATGVLQGVLGGWQLNGIYNYATGRPLKITTGRFTLSAVTASTPNFTGSSFHLSKVNKGATQVTTVTPEQLAQFSNPGAGEAGNLPLYSFRGPAYSNFDASLFKKFKMPWLGESGEAQFRIEMFNVFNHTNFQAPNADINSGSFGVISQAFPARIGQLALKIVF